APVVEDQLVARAGAHRAPVPRQKGVVDAIADARGSVGGNPGYPRRALSFKMVDTRHDGRRLRKHGQRTHRKGVSRGRERPPVAAGGSAMITSTPTRGDENRRAVPCTK